MWMTRLLPCEMCLVVWLSTIQRRLAWWLNTYDRPLRNIFQISPVSQIINYACVYIYIYRERDLYTYIYIWCRKEMCNAAASDCMFRSVRFGVGVF